MSAMRTCKACGETKPETEYYRKAPERLDTQCKACRYKKNLEYRRINRDKVRAKQREWDRNNAEKISKKRQERLALLSDEERAAISRKTNEGFRRLADKKKREYLEEHGQTPLCLCGCGEHVGFNDKGRVNRYINGHQVVAIPGHINDRFDMRERIPIERVREALQRIRNERGWSVAELAERAGLSLTHMQGILYDKRKWNKYGIDRTLVEQMFRRIQGLPTVPSSYMLKQYTRTIQRLNRLDEELDKY